MRNHRDEWMQDTSDEHDRFAEEDEHCEDGDDHVEICDAISRSAGHSLRPRTE